ncbi:cation transporter [Methylobacillus flagellatus]|jgi:Co/Zn/Cd efflux system component|uniref:Cation efflux protein n=1 Tax=Methylobacillus flagellatus (strain ATCC 51484 / DSM 6875 / VKM B-1610 / KT) TaxID=265072 RepID=Q1H4A8_METFK|nr:cation transporter [Methylobacillus flagellatus]ABE48679.1 cation efflux protein [Methylobacillus flagellatus KT]
MSDCGCEFEAKNNAELKVLRILLGINAAMFVVEFVAGLAAHSTGLLADSLDMFADASVYAISLYAVGREISFKARAARVSGVLQILLGLSVLVEVGRRFIFGSEPESGLMLGIGALALSANIVCLALLAKHRDGEVHMRASWIFSANDVIANLGVILSGILVAITSSRVPDLVIGLLIAAVVVRGGLTILREARAAGADHGGRT